MKKETDPDIIKIIDHYLDGKLSRIQIDKLWARLLQNPDEYKLLKTQAGLKKIQLDQLRNLREPEDPYQTAGRPPVHGWVTGSRISWIAALAAVLAITLFLYLFRSNVETGISPPLSEINPVNLVAPDITRSSSEEMSEFEQGLYRAYMLTVSGETDEAITEYEQLLHDEPHSHLINYNLGILYFNKGDTRASVSRFRKVDCTKLQETTRTESCYWFKTNTLVSAGDMNGAKEFAKKTREMRGYFEKDAFDLLIKIQYQQEKKHAD